jgi:hypothetical protein
MSNASFPQYVVFFVAVIGILVSGAFWVVATVLGVTAFSAILWLVHILLA